MRRSVRYLVEIWELLQLMNGMSMAAPHITGALAQALSGMRAVSLPWSPFSVKRAVENTSTHVPETLKTPPKKSRASA